MKNVAILGYGNLGKAVEEELLKNNELNLVGIFSKREIVSEYKTKCYKERELFTKDFEIDLVFMCGGSQNDIPAQIQKVAKKYNLINSYDNHTKIVELKEKTDNIAKKNNKVALFSCGWDPGIFSMVRILNSIVFQQNATIFWGKGISMGHSDVVRKIDGVKNAIAFTIPKNKLHKLKKKFTHKRLVFVVKQDNALKSEIVKKIKDNKDYFSNCYLKIKFVSEKKFKKNFLGLNYHAGEVVNFVKQKGHKYNFSLKLKMSSNAHLTAKIMIAFSSFVLKKQKEMLYGAYYPCDVPISDLMKDEHYKLI